MSFPMPPTTTATNASGFSFGLASNANTLTKPTFSFGSPIVSAGGGDADVSAKTAAFIMAGTTNVATTQATATQTSGAAQAAHGFVAPTSVIQPSLTMTTTAVTTTTALATSLPSAIGGLSAHVATKAPTVAAVPLNQSTSFANLSTATKTSDSNTSVQTQQITYNQLEEHINKWTLEFEEQEKIFSDQATQINAWDKILLNNNHKILDLNDAVQKVKADQQILEQELEFIATQHKELEESIAPLQKEFANIPQVDVERSQTYLLVENLDTQLKQMSEDLKEMIDNLNEVNRGQDNSDPIIQIGKILNAHMSSLQWIESSSTSICNKLDDISRIHEAQKREAYRSAYYD